MATQLNINAIADGAINASKLGDISSKAETPSNKVSSWSETPNDTHYPSEKLVKDYVDTALGNIEATLQSIRGVN